MSLTALFIGGLHAIPVLIGSTLGGAGLVGGALLSLFIAINFGSGNYLLYDIFGIVAGILIGKPIADRAKCNI